MRTIKQRKISWSAWQVIPYPRCKNWRGESALCKPYSKTSLAVWPAQPISPGLALVSLSFFPNMKLQGISLQTVTPAGKLPTHTGQTVSWNRDEQTVVGVVFGLFHTAWATQFVWSEHSEEVFVLTWFTFRSFAAPFQFRLINSLADPFPWMGCEGSACSMLLGLAMMALTQGPGASLENNWPKKVRVCYLSFDKLYSSECVLIIFSNWLWVSNRAFVTEGTFSPLFLVLLEQGFGAVRCFCFFRAF